MIHFRQDDTSSDSGANTSSGTKREPIGIEHPLFVGIVRRITIQRRASWRRSITQQEAEWTLVADFIARRGLLFLDESTSWDPNEFKRRMHRRLDNHARHLFLADFNSSRHRTVRGDVLDFTGLDLAQFVNPHSSAIDPAEAAERNDFIASVRKTMLATLTAVELQVIESRFINGRSVSETAISLDLTASMVRQIQTTAVAKLRIALAEYHSVSSSHCNAASSTIQNSVA